MQMSASPAAEWLRKEFKDLKYSSFEKQHTLGRREGLHILEDPLIFLGAIFSTRYCVLVTECFGLDLKKSAESDWRCKPVFHIGTPDVLEGSANFGMAPDVWFALNPGHFTKKTTEAWFQIYRRRIFDFWRPLPRSEAEVRAFSTEMFDLAMTAWGCEDLEFDVQFAQNLAPRSALSWHDRVMRDFQTAHDWCAFGELYRLAEELEQITAAAEDEPQKYELYEQAHLKAERRLAFGLTYAVIDVLSTDAYAVGINLTPPGALERSYLDITEPLRTNLLNLIRQGFAVDAPFSSITEADFALIDRWRSGGRDEVLAEYPFWLKR